MIAAGMNHVSDQTCITFMPRTDENYYIDIVPANGGCYTWIPLYGFIIFHFQRLFDNFVVSGFGRIEIGLTRSWCVQQYVVVHEILHILGFGHEQSRPDRDQYITVNWDNMPVCSRLNFH